MRRLVMMALPIVVRYLKKRRDQRPGQPPGRDRRL